MWCDVGGLFRGQSHLLFKIFESCGVVVGVSFIQDLILGWHES